MTPKKKPKASRHSEKRKHKAVIPNTRCDIEAVLCAAAFGAAPGGAGFALRSPPEMVRAVNAIKSPLPLLSLVLARSSIVIGISVAVSPPFVPTNMSLAVVPLLPLFSVFAIRVNYGEKNFESSYGAHYRPPPPTPPPPRPPPHHHHNVGIILNLNRACIASARHSGFCCWRCPCRRRSNVVRRTAKIRTSTSRRVGVVVVVVVAVLLLLVL